MTNLQAGSVTKGVKVEDMCGEYRAASRTSPSQAADLSALPMLPRRWVPHRKAEVVNAVQCGVITLGRACELYAISIEEFTSWQRDIAMFGLAGLRAKRRRPPFILPRQT